MALDKELYQKAYDLHRQWNEAELIEQVRTAKLRNPGEGWRQFIELWEFGHQMRLVQSKYQCSENQKARVEYYNRIQKFESWRRTRGRIS